MRHLSGRRYAQYMGREQTAYTISNQPIKEPRGIDKGRQLKASETGFRLYRELEALTF
ncbi:hypothetical protein FACS189462_4070 [Spirochaetia bacterium]|nr:hypothetical protein FACS189462_4070 [Spirochaetia bacterium]